MVSARDSNPQRLIEKVSEKLKETVTPPVWSKYVKTGSDKQRAPDNEDWFFTRSASLLRRIMVDGPIGVEKLRVHYGGRKNRGHKPERFMKASGAVIRNAIQQLESNGLVKKDKKGRVLTGKGQSLLDQTAKELSKKE